MAQGQDESSLLKPRSSMVNVKAARLKDGTEGVAIGEEDLFVAVETLKEGGLRVRLLNLFGSHEVLTGWIPLATPEDLKASKKADEFRKDFEKMYGIKAQEVLDRIVEVMEDANHRERSYTISEPPLAPATEIGDTFAYTGDRPFHGRVQIVALATPESRFTRLRFSCKEPGECGEQCPLRKGLTISIDGSLHDPSSFATYFDTNDFLDALEVLFSRKGFLGCPEWRRKVSYSGRDERAVTHAVAYDLGGCEGRAWFLHGENCDLKRAPNWVIVTEGYLCHGARGRIGVLILGFKSESEVMAPTHEQVEAAGAILRGLVEREKGLEGCGAYKIAKTLRLAVNAKGDEVRKGFLADLLTVASPMWVRTPESGDKELGATTCEIGPSTSYKSQRERFLINWLGAGKYLRGRKTEAGLTIGLEKVEGIGWVAKKGALPSSDLSFLIVDNMPPHALDEQIESRRDGICTVAGIKSMEVWARCRLKLLGNPVQPFDELVYKCVALKVFDPKLVARFAFAVYTYGVSPEERYDPSVYELTEQDRRILDAARTWLLWNLSHESTYEVTVGLWPKIMEFSKDLEAKYGVEDIPLLLRNIPYKLAVLAYSFAVLDGETEPTERHYELAKEWIEFCAKDIELDKYADVQRALRNLSEEEYRKIKEAIENDIISDVRAKGGTLRDSYVFKLSEYVVKHGKSRRDELAAYLEVDEKTISRKVNILKGLGLLRSDKDGYSFTPKGVKFVKRWLPDVPDVSVVPASKANAPAREKDQAAPLPSEGGDMGDKRDMESRACEVCGGPTNKCYVREGRLVWLCEECLSYWEGKL